jgi:hypothetical protein
MACDDSSAMKRACPPELAGMNGQDACLAMKDWQGKQKSGFAEFVGAFGSHNDSVTNVVNKTGIKIDTKQVSEAVASCELLASIVQSNLVDTTECDKLMSDEIETLEGYIQVLEMANKPDAAARTRVQLKELRAANSRSGTMVQTNDATLVSKCKVSALLSALSKSDMTIANSAMIDMIQKSSGPLTSNSNTSNTCNDVSIKKSACQYLSDKSCCMSKFESKQTNSIVGCPKFESYVQTNRLDANLSCDATAASDVQDVTDIKSSNSSKAKIDQSAELIPSGVSIASVSCSIVLIVTIGCIGIAWAYFAYSDSNQGEPFGADANHPVNALPIAGKRPMSRSDYQRTARLPDVASNGR